jgi:hypothetical protein
MNPIRIDLAYSENNTWFGNYTTDRVPRFGEIINYSDGLYQVDQTVWHPNYNYVTMYVTDRSGQGLTLPKAEGWNTDFTQMKMDGTPYFLTVLIKDKPQTRVGGFDNVWTCKDWVYNDNRVPTGTVPLAWRELPKAYGKVS